MIKTKIRPLSANCFTVPAHDNHLENPILIMSQLSELGMLLMTSANAAS